MLCTPQPFIAHKLMRTILPCDNLADAFGWLSYLRPATEQLQRLDMSQNPLLRLSTASECTVTSSADCLGNHLAPQLPHVITAWHTVAASQDGFICCWQPQRSSTTSAPHCNQQALVRSICALICRAGTGDTDAAGGRPPQAAISSPHWHDQ